MDRRVNMDGGVDGGSDAGIAMGGMPGQAGDTITGFEDGRDSVKIDGNSITAIYAKVSDGNTVLYSTRNSANSNADSDILAVINGFAATDADFTTDDFDGNLVTTVEDL